VLERYRYDAYGKRTILADDGTTTRATSLYGNQIGYTGLYQDAETGLSVADNRYYDPTLGRWIGHDPWMKKPMSPASGDGYQDGMNLYAAYFIPNRTDPTGLAPVSPSYPPNPKPNPTCDPPAEKKYCVYEFLLGDAGKTLGGVPAGGGLRICTECPVTKACPYSDVSRKASLTYDDGSNGFNLEYALVGRCVDCPDGAAEGGQKRDEDTRKWLFKALAKELRDALQDK